MDVGGERERRRAVPEPAANLFADKADAAALAMDAVIGGGAKA
jgi:hypothetical protein